MLIREGADDQTWRRIYMAVVQVVMLYGPKTWLMTLCTKKVWGGFRHRVDRRLTGV